MQQYENSILEAIPGETPKQKFLNLTAMMMKCAKWDALDKKIAQFYPEEEKDEDQNEGALDSIGEFAAIAFGYM